jgi:dihydrofolate reductase
MRKIIVLSMITLDGVMQAPGAPEEDTSGGFKYGGWVAPYFDEVYGKVLEKQLKPADLLLGRKTFEIFADYWPEHENGWPGINDVTKVFLKSLADIEKLKNSKGSDI